MSSHSVAHGREIAFGYLAGLRYKELTEAQSVGVKRKFGKTDMQSHYIRGPKLPDEQMVEFLEKSPDSFGTFFHLDSYPSNLREAWQRISSQDEIVR